MSSHAEIPAGFSAGEIMQAFSNNLRSRLGRLEQFATKNDLYLALALAVRERHVNGKTMFVI